MQYPPANFAEIVYGNAPINCHTNSKNSIAAVVYDIKMHPQTAD